MVLLVDFIVLNIAIIVAYILRRSAIEFPPSEKLPLYFVAPIISVVLAYIFGVYEAAARNYSHSIERKLALSQLVAALAWVVLLLVVGMTGFARSVLVIYTLLAVFCMIVIRRFASLIFNYRSRSIFNHTQTVVIVYGAGREGMVVTESLRRDGRYRPVAFLDTDYTLVDRMVSGLRVYPIETVIDVINKFKPRDIIIAKSGLNRANRRVLVDMLLGFGVSVKTAPGLEEIIDGNVRIGDIRPIRVEDLLGRDPVPPERVLMEKALRDQVIMITGAGGSIGSELVRQAAEYAPKKIILVENSEFALFEIHREIESKHFGPTKFELIPILADVQSKQNMISLMKTHSVDVVFHAAAYKHVRMVQENAIAGIRNNVFGTKALAEAAIENRVKRFILISTDKAVRPTSIMGASKRTAEMVVQSIADEKNHNTIFSIVRFGNVLGSTGSVVPLFREQIAAGGPVTVTHPDVTRYFMLIPEAAQLVIQTGAMASGGEVFVLDMGEPIKIVRLAETMIDLAGLKNRRAGESAGDIEIVFTGLKDGEKLYEELQIGTNILNTPHPRIMLAREVFLKSKQLMVELQKLDVLLIAADAEAATARVLKLANFGQKPSTPPPVEQTSSLRSSVEPTLQHQQGPDLISLHTFSSRKFCP